ncbi:MAG: excinuclease ABC subunit UvrB [Armatimonadota bacterium]|nr:excinuclease ABC subunit UvrB [Armatimonadota bacterium]MDR7460483.1 excinuclease ABC subunit UvrB [Armatimonadota bacterium]MDR7478244.1 excinuclease ABC subunit UvrB [Armatimonadota bacterium]MDR7488857.1 excinuclease ABC subunit UvrB [Armatimonadota bacterium]MDR7491560.1 excinuclease ABC subunit UvrB [Armatimonadota bacterium]
MEPRGDQPKAIAELVESIQAGNRFTTLLGVTGSGKSVVADTPVYLRQGGRIQLQPIGQVVDALMAHHHSAVRWEGDAEVLDLAGTGHQLEALSLDPGSGRVSWKPVRQVIRHRAPRQLWKVRTACGRSVTVTGDHNFFVLRDGRLQLLETSAIRPGDYLPLPRTLDEPPAPLTALALEDVLDDGVGDGVRIAVAIPAFGAVWKTKHQVLRAILPSHRAAGLLRGERMALRTYRDLVAAIPALRAGARMGSRRRFHDLPADLPITPLLMRFIGYFLAEGYVGRGVLTISSADPGVIQDIEAAARSFGLRVRRGPGRYDYTLPSVLWARLLTTWCGRKARDKHLPPFWPQLANADLAELLRAYFSADGGVEGDEVTATTASATLASDLAYALLRFGIVARVRERHVRVPYWRLSVSGQPFLRRFREAIGFRPLAKQDRLNALCGGRENTNVDVIPLDPEVLRDVRRQLGLSQTQVARHVALSRSALALIEGGRRRPSKTVAKRVLDFLADEAHMQEHVPVLRRVREMQVLLNPFWTRVEVVAPARGEARVYDLAVAEHETFLAGVGGLFVHNTYTMAHVIAQVQRPTLVIAHNKTLAAQLYSEFREFFPHNAVRYFVSYYDYYQPEAYVPQTDLYIAKDASINDEIDRLRHAATKALMERRDVIVVASVSCIYGLGRPEDYREVMLLIRRGERRSREEILRRLVDIQYERNDVDFARGRFRVRGDVIEVFPAYEERAVRVELFGDEVDRILELDPLTGEVLEEKSVIAIWPAKHWVTTEERLERALRSIEEELQERVAWFRQQGKLLEAQRLEFRTRYDLELLREVGYCPGIENYSRHLDGRAPGERPGCLLDYFPRDFLMFIDESHVTVPQIKGMVEGDRSRKKNLVDFGFRLPSAYDNRPLTWEEFERLIHQAIFVSATPGPFELEVSQRVVEQIVRPTGLVDPHVEVRPARGQIDDLIGEIRAQAAKGERTLVTTLTKRMAEDLTAYLAEMGLKVHYLHAEVETLERVQILKDLRLGTYDVLVGINLLREGLDLPEVSLVAILDADREGYLRSETSLIQTMGRAARHASGRVLLYADAVTESMRRAIDETNRRREIQLRYNAEHGITPQSVVKPIRDLIDIAQVAEELEAYRPQTEVLTAQELIRLAETQRAKVPWSVARLLMLSPQELEETIAALEREMRRAAAELQFEKAAVLRDQIQELRQGLGEPFFQRGPVGAGARGRGNGPGRRGGGTGRGRRRRNGRR